MGGETREAEVMPTSRAFLLRRTLAAVTLLAPHAVRAQAAAKVALPAGFAAERIATVRGARELSIAPNGDLFVGTTRSAVYVVPDAEGTAGAPRAFATFDDGPVASVFVAADAIYAGGQFGVYRIPYRSGDREARAKPEKIAALRPGGARGHSTTTVALSRGVLYASVGSSCNACEEHDPTRATVQAMTPDGKNMHARAVGIRNAIALAVNPADGSVCAGVAGRDDLNHGHPYEIFDDLTAHARAPDYGWLLCSAVRQPT